MIDLMVLVSNDDGLHVSQGCTFWKTRDNAFRIICINKTTTHHFSRNIIYGPVICASSIPNHGFTQSVGLRLSQ